MNKTTPLITAAFLLVGCNQRSIEWRPDRKPETVAERAAVERETVAILSATPITKLEGHDQDWDDAIAAAHKVAVQTQCRTRLYEWERIGFPSDLLNATGRIKELDQDQR